MSTKNFMFIGNKEKKSFRLSIKTSLHTTSNFSSTYLCTQYHLKTTKTLFKLPKLPTTLQGGVQTHLPPIIEQSLDYIPPMPLVSVASLLNQRRHITRQHLYLSKTDRPKSQRHHLNIVLSETKNMPLDTSRPFK